MEALFQNLQTLGIVFFTLSILSFLYKDNPVYRLAEHLFLGIATGYFIVIQYHTIFQNKLLQPFWNQGLKPFFTADAIDFWAFMLFIPFIFGFMMFSKFNAKTSWIARWPLAVVVGGFAGAAIIGFAQGDLIEQVRGNIIPLVARGSWSAFTSGPGLMSFLTVISNLVLIIGVVAALFYFYFSKEHSGWLGTTAMLGIWVLMISFGASYGNTVMTRISLFAERATRLIEQPAYTIGGTVLIVAFLTFHHFRSKGGGTEES